MKNKGFTLVELLAVIFVLGLILAIAVPPITGILKNSAKDVFKKDAEAILRAITTEKIKDSTLNVSFITKDNLKTYLTIDTTNYDSVTFSYNKSTGEISITIDGKNKFENLIAYGTIGNISVITGSTFVPVPELATGMMPVYYDDIAGVWKKANSNNDNNNWYDYDSQKWANAVTVTSTNRATYTSADVGTTISMSDINTMFVWIPRYKYRIPAGTGAREIEIIFENKTTTKSTGDAISEYYTHPAFTLGTEELSGIWVGKFEMTGTISALTIKPDLSSIRIQTVKAMYDSIKNTMQGQTTTYGFDNNSDIHMMKNEEWGAAAYLSHSKYGIYGNSNFAVKEIYLNNSSSYYTGRSMGAVGGSGVKTPTNEYIDNGYYTYDGKCAKIYAGITECGSGTIGQTITNKNLSFGASASGTIYGIYDMSGGAWEYVMGMYKPVTLSGIADVTGYSSATTNSQYDLLTINTKYYYPYTTTSSATACNGGKCQGHALSETSGWYSDYAGFVIASYPWFIRGGSRVHGASAGAFSFTGIAGGVNSDISFRAVLAP